MIPRKCNTNSCRVNATSILLVGLLVLTVPNNVSSFQLQHNVPALSSPLTIPKDGPSTITTIPSRKRTARTSQTPATRLSMTFDDVNSFYQTYPLQAAVLTCGIKASLADCIAQVRTWTKSDRAIELRRNAAYIIYGGIFIGLMCHIEYDVIFPMLFGTGHSVQTVVEEVLFDNFVSAPLMWLPPAYFIKAVLFDYPLEEGLERYFTDIREGLLFKYWAVWLPAQTISFSVVPEALRVLFMACISFGWFIVLSSAQSQTDASANGDLEGEFDFDFDAAADSEANNASSMASVSSVPQSTTLAEGQSAVKT